MQKLMKTAKIIESLQNCTFSPELVSKQLSQERYISPERLIQSLKSKQKKIINSVKEFSFKPKLVSK